MITRDEIKSLIKETRDQAFQEEYERKIEALRKENYQLKDQIEILKNKLNK